MAEKPTPSMAMPLAAVDERDVLPGFHPGLDQVGGLGIVRAQEVEGAVGEHDAEAEGRAGRVLLEDLDLALRLPPLPQIGEVEPGRAAAEDGDPPQDHLRTRTARRRSAARS
jgi:hypothetical protein